MTGPGKIWRKVNRNNSRTTATSRNNGTNVLTIRMPYRSNESELWGQRGVLRREHQVCLEESSLTTPQWHHLWAIMPPLNAVQARATPIHARVAVNELEGVGRTHDHDLPFVDIIIVNESCWEPLHWALCQLCRIRSRQIVLIFARIRQYTHGLTQELLF